MKRSSKLTQEVVDAASPRKTEHIIIDAWSEGLALRVRPNGSKTWQLRWREDGKLMRASLGNARKISLAHDRKRAADATWTRDETEVAAVDRGMYFADLATEFVQRKERAGLRSRSPRIYARSQLISNFGYVPAAEISTPRVASWFHEYSMTRPGGANEALRLLAAILAFGREEGLIPRATPDP